MDPLNPNEHIIDYCCREVRRGAIIVFPTETVYGLGAYIYNIESIKKIFTAKGRPIDNPLIVHIASLNQINEVVKEIPNDLEKILAKIWPGPLTLVLKKSERIYLEISGNLPTVAIRIPAHPVALRLIECTGPIAAPSANISGRPSPTEPHHVYVDMFGRVDIIVDAGATFFGIESTIIDLSTDPPRLLRPGALSYEEISRVLGKKIIVPDFARGLCEGIVALAPGIKYKHYSPKTTLLVVEANDYRDLDAYVKKLIDVAKEKCCNKRCVIIASRETADVYKALGFITIIIGSRQNLYEVAKNLFNVLREIDRFGVDLGIVEGFPDIGIGMTIMNRLRKASGLNIVKMD